MALTRAPLSPLMLRRTLTRTLTSSPSHPPPPPRRSRAHAGPLLSASAPVLVLPNTAVQACKELAALAPRGRLGRELGGEGARALVRLLGVLLWYGEQAAATC